MSKRNPWLDLSFDTWALGLEASTVIGLRMMKLAAGGAAAQTEAAQMISEKLEAGLLLQTRAMTGALGFTPDVAAARAVKHYRRKVRANRRRLSR